MKEKLALVRQQALLNRLVRHNRPWDEGDAVKLVFPVFDTIVVHRNNTLLCAIFGEKLGAGIFGIVKHSIAGRIFILAFIVSGVTILAGICINDLPMANMASPVFFILLSVGYGLIDLSLLKLVFQEFEILFGLVNNVLISSLMLSYLVNRESTMTILLISAQMVAMVIIDSVTPRLRFPFLLCTFGLSLSACAIFASSVTFGWFNIVRRNEKVYFNESMYFSVDSRLLSALGNITFWCTYQILYAIIRPANLWTCTAPFEVKKVSPEFIPFLIRRENMRDYDSASIYPHSPKGDTRDDSAHNVISKRKSDLTWFMNNISSHVTSKTLDNTTLSSESRLVIVPNLETFQISNPRFLFGNAFSKISITVARSMTLSGLLAFCWIVPSILFWLSWFPLLPEETRGAMAFTSVMVIFPTAISLGLCDAQLFGKAIRTPEAIFMIGNTGLCFTFFFMIAKSLPHRVGVIVLFFNWNAGTFFECWPTSMRKRLFPIQFLAWIEVGVLSLLIFTGDFDVGDREFSILGADGFSIRQSLLSCALNIFLFQTKSLISLYVHPERLVLVRCTLRAIKIPTNIVELSQVRGQRFENFSSDMGVENE